MFLLLLVGPVGHWPLNSQCGGADEMQDRFNGVIHGGVTINDSAAFNG